MAQHHTRHIQKQIRVEGIPLWKSLSYEFFERNYRLNPVLWRNLCALRLLRDGKPDETLRKRTPDAATLLADGDRRLDAYNKCDAFTVLFANNCYFCTKKSLKWIYLSSYLC